MTAPAIVQTRKLRVNLRVAQQFLSFEKQPEPGKKGANRRFSRRIVDRYCADMLQGQWRYNHQGMAFLGFISDGTAEFKDGGHRCRALVQAATTGVIVGDVFLEPQPDIAFDFMVTEGLDPEAWYTMDVGKGRSPGDFFSADGEANSHVLSSICTLAWLYLNVDFDPHAWSKSRLLTPLRRSQFLAENPGLREAMYEGARANKVMTVSSASVGCFLALESGRDKNKVDQFMDSLIDGVHLDKDDPIRRLRELLISSRRGRPREEQLALFIKAYLKWEKGQACKQLSFRPYGDAPEAFPRF